MWILRKQRSNYNKIGKRNGENCGTNLHMPNISNENISHGDLDSEVSVPANVNLPSGRDNAAGGKINMNHLEIPVQQRMIELNLSECAHKRTQKKGYFGYGVVSIFHV